MKRKLLPLLLAALLLIPTTALAHGPGDQPIVHEEPAQVGPYRVTVGFSEWPTRAEKSVQYVVHPQGGLAGKQAFLAVVPADGHARGNLDWTELMTYPGLDDAWVHQTLGVSNPGMWKIEIKMVTAQGTFAGSTKPFLVDKPPGIPMWFGWVVGLIPLYGVIWFGVREWRQKRGLMAGGDHAAA